jgi:hypothetical protein
MKAQKHVNAEQSTAAIERFDFHGDELDVAREGDVLWVSVRRVCDALGVAANMQIAKLKGKPWAGGMMIISPSDGGPQSTFCLPLRALPMWLATIEPSRVAESVRAKLERYQVECADALADYFFGPVSTASDASLAADIASLRDEVAAMRAENALARLSGGLLGQDLAQRMLGRVRVLAWAWVAQGRALTPKSAAMAIRQHLSAVLGFGGTGAAWRFFPMSRRNELEVALAVLERDVHRVATTARQKAALVAATAQTGLPWNSN